MKNPSYIEYVQSFSKEVKIEYTIKMKFGEDDPNVNEL